MSKNLSQETKDKISKAMQGNANAAGFHNVENPSSYRKKGAVDHDTIRQRFIKKYKSREYSGSIANSVARIMFINAGHEEIVAIAKQVNKIRKVRKPLER